MVTDKYLSTIKTPCYRCKKFNNDSNPPIPHSCKEYPKRDGIPPEIWYGREVECSFFESKEEYKKFNELFKQM